MRFGSKLIFIGAVSITMLGTAHAEKKAHLLYSFGTGADGQLPDAGVIRDADGTLYGTTEGGGAGGAGTIYKITPDKQEVILHAFQGGDGSNPFSGLTKDGQGNLYGTTCCGGETNNGVVYKLAPDGTFTVLHSFANGSDGAEAVAGVAVDKKGTIYGATFRGGVNDRGVIFKVTPKGKYKVLYTFSGGTDGGLPAGAPLLNKDGSLIGTTEKGGANNFGTVYKLAPDGKETVLYSFKAQDDGATPYAGVVRDNNGDLYGTAQETGANSAGTLFRLSSSGAFTVLHAFGAAGDGTQPLSAPTLVKDKNGDTEIYGTTTFGGASTVGVAYKLSAKNQYKILHTFTGLYDRESADAGEPRGSLVVGPGGKLYGASQIGGATGNGTVFEIRQTKSK